MAGDSQDVAQRPSAVSTLRQRLSTFSARCRSLFESVRSSSERVATNRRLTGNVIQLSGVATTLVGCFVLFGLGVGLVLTGLTVVGVGAMHERGLI